MPLLERDSVHPASAGFTMKLSSCCGATSTSLTIAAASCLSERHSSACSVSSCLACREASAPRSGSARSVPTNGRWSPFVLGEISCMAQPPAESASAGSERANSFSLGLLSIARSAETVLLTLAPATMGLGGR